MQTDNTWTAPHIHRPEDMATRRVNVRLDPAFLANMLGLPKGSRIVAVRADHDPVAFSVLVEHEDLPPVPQDAWSPFVHVELLGTEIDGRQYWSPRAAFHTVDGWDPKDATAAIGSDQ